MVACQVIYLFRNLFETGVCCAIIAWDNVAELYNGSNEEKRQAKTG